MKKREGYHGNRKLNQKGNHVQRFRAPAAESASTQSAEDQQSRAGTERKRGHENESKMSRGESQ